jgi:hypothetical protein
VKGRSPQLDAQFWRHRFTTASRPVSRQQNLTFALTDAITAVLSDSPQLEIADQMKKRTMLWFDPISPFPLPKSIVGACRNRVERLIVEFDTCATDIFVALQESYRYLTQDGLSSSRV